MIVNCGQRKQYIDHCTVRKSFKICFKCILSISTAHIHLIRILYHHGQAGLVYVSIKCCYKRNYYIMFIDSVYKMRCPISVIKYMMEKHFEEYCVYLSTIWQRKIFNVPSFLSPLKLFSKNFITLFCLTMDSGSVLLCCPSIGPYNLSQLIQIIHFILHTHVDYMYGYLLKCANKMS